MVKFSDTEAVSELSENLTLPKISRCTVEVRKQSTKNSGLSQSSRLGQTNFLLTELTTVGKYALRVVCLCVALYQYTKSTEKRVYY